MTRQDCVVFRYHDFTGELNALTNDVMNSLKLQGNLKNFLILIALTAWLPLSMILSPLCTLCTALFSLTDTAPLGTGDTRALVTLTLSTEHGPPGGELTAD